MFIQVDIFGKPVELNFNGKDKSRTFAGACFSILFFLFIGCSICLLGQDLVNHKDPKTTTSESLAENPEPMILSPETFNFGFGLRHPGTLAHYINKSIYTIEANRRQLRRAVNKDGNLEMKWTVTPLLLETCTKEHFGPLAQHFENIELNELYCLKKNQSQLEEIRIQGALESPIFEDVLIIIKQCDNQTSEIPCEPKENINELLGRGWFATYFPNLAIETRNYSNPTLSYRDSFYTSISNSYFKELTLWLSHIEVSTDSGWVLSEIKNDHYIKFDHFQESTSFGSNLNGMMNFVIRVEKITKNYGRSYIKVQDLIAKINGLVTISIIIGFIFIMPYSNIKFYERLINELFDVKDLQKNQKDSHTRNYTKAGITIVDGDKPNHEENQQLDIENLFRKHSKKVNSLASPDGIKGFEKSVSSQNKIFEVGQICKKLSPRSPAGKDNSLIEKNLFHSLTNNNKNVRFSKRETIKEQKNDENTSSTDPKFLDTTIEPILSKLNPHLLREKPKITDQPCVRKSETEETPHLEDTFIALDVVLDKQKDSTCHKDPEILNKAKQVSMHTDLDQKREDQNINYVKTEQNFEQKLDEKELIKRAELLPTQLIKDSYHINITFSEYIQSFFWKSEKLKQKFGLLEEGIRRIQERLNIFNLLKKLREVDKLKLLLLENEQLILFDALPNPELSFNAYHRKNTKRISFFRLKEAIFVAEKKKNDLVKNSYIDLKKKLEGTMIDKKLLEIYDDIIDF